MSHVLHIDADEFESVVINSDKPVILDFYSEECPPCEVLAPIFEKMNEKYGEHIKFVKMQRQINRDFAKSINVTSSPTLLFYHNGIEVGHRLNGYMNKPQVRKAIEEVLGDVIPPVPMQNVDCDVIILGAGPAGLAAALYAARARLDVVVIDQSVPGGQAASTYHIANYPGTEGIITGRALTDNMRNQANMFGARIDDLKEVMSVEFVGKVKKVVTEDTTYRGKVAIVATGSVPRALPAEGGDEFKGRGVHYCATCDGAMYQGRKLIVVGGGSSAMEEAVFLTRFATEVYIVHRSDKFRAAAIEIEMAKSNPKIKFMTSTIIKKVHGQGHGIGSVELEDINTGATRDFAVDGIFVYIGNEPMTDMCSEEIELDNDRYIIADEDCKTNIPGVYVAGDIRSKPIRQVVTATADGAVAGIMAERYIRML
ncbi:MAG: FAD-dependent oxidoreductase [Eubacteriales bacterium]|nr:FAD-dependent oxidoreductase [Eubacteriales bacterium]